MANNAFSRAVALLARREHSVVELEQKLVQKGFAKQDACNALEKCMELDLQSDERYADMVLRTKLSQGYGPIYIRKFLLSKGILDTTIKKILTEPEINWQEQAKCVLEKKLLSNPDKAWSFLLYRGFDSDTIKSVVVYL